MKRGVSAWPRNKHDADHDEGYRYKEGCHKERSENLFDHEMPPEGSGGNVRAASVRPGQDRTIGPFMTDSAELRA